MRRFRYRAYDSTGAQTAGELSVESRQAALDALARKSQVAVELSEVTEAAITPWWNREIGGHRKLAPRRLAEFTRELSSLAGSSIPVHEALQIMAMQPSLAPALKAVVVDVLGRVREGNSLSEALAASGGGFPEYYVRVVGAGEVSGSLETVLEELSRYIEQSSERRSRIISQLLYPAVLVIAAVAALALVALVLAPAVQPLFEDAGAEPPLVIELLAAFERFVTAHSLSLLSGAAALLVLALVTWRNPAGRLAMDSALLRSPILGTLIMQSETARLARTLSTLLSNGVALPEAIRISGEVLSNRRLAAATGDVLDSVQRGGTFSAELTGTALFPDLLSRLARVGEETGQLETMLMKAADVFERAVHTRIERFMTLLTPVLTLLIGGFVGLLVVSVMNAILTANTLVFQ